jgi:hypothetical protein
VEEVGEAWTRRWRRRGRRRSVFLMAVPERGGEGQADDAVVGCFNIEEERSTGVEKERGADVEAHVEEGMQWRACG